MMYWVYILYCNNDTYYTGYTSDLARRYQQHLHGTGGCKYTRSFRPLAIAQCWKISHSKSLAMRLERQIKKMSRRDKEQLVKKPSGLAFHKDVQVVSKKERMKISFRTL